MNSVEGLPPISVAMLEGSYYCSLPYLVALPHEHSLKSTILAVGLAWESVS